MKWNNPPSSKNRFPERQNESRDFLRKWQTIRLKLPFTPGLPGPDNVTALCYCFGTEEWISSHFCWFLCALRETWRCCGMLKTCFVANTEAKELRELKKCYPDWIDIRISDNLLPEPYPDDIHSMSLDMNENLSKWFDTDYCLVIQDDGFPLRSGLEEFLGKYDFYGSPLRSMNPIQWLKGLYTHAWPSNGGFSLRSHRCCEMANKLFKEHYASEPYSISLCEDIFYSSRLPRNHKEFRKTVRIAPFTAAGKFSFEGFNMNNDLKFGAPCPFGFHSSRGFAYLYRNRILPSDLMVPGLEP